MGSFQGFGILVGLSSSWSPVTTLDGFKKAIAHFENNFQLSGNIKDEQALCMDYVLPLLFATLGEGAKTPIPGTREQERTRVIQEKAQEYGGSLLITFFKKSLGPRPAKILGGMKFENLEVDPEVGTVGLAEYVDAGLNRIWASTGNEAGPPSYAAAAAVIFALGFGSEALGKLHNPDLLQRTDGWDLLGDILECTEACSAVDEDQRPALYQFLTFCQLGSCGFPWIKMVRNKYAPAKKRPAQTKEGEGGYATPAPRRIPQYHPEGRDDVQYVDIPEELFNKVMKVFPDGGIPRGKYRAEHWDLLERTLVCAGESNPYISGSRDGVFPGEQRYILGGVWLHIGNARRPSGRRVTKASEQMPKFFAAVGRMKPNDFGALNFIVNYGISTRLHIDGLNAGESLSCSVGDFELSHAGGDLLRQISKKDGFVPVDKKSYAEVPENRFLQRYCNLEKNTRFEGVVQNTKRSWTQFNARLPHSTLPTSGKRIVIIFFTHRSSVSAIENLETAADGQQTTLDWLATHGWPMPKSNKVI